MIRFKSCPKCGCDVWVAEGRQGWYEVCLACAFVRDHISPAAVEAGAWETSRA